MDLAGTLQHELEGLNLTIDPEAGERLLWLLQEMLRWNRTHNLTAITDPLVGIEKHLVDSLTLLPLVEVGQTLLDIGSGAGFPSLPLKIVQPDLDVVSVDSVAKKISFQKHVVRTLQLDHFLPWHGRAEHLPEQPFAAMQFDRVVARAFSSLEQLVELALPCLRPTGSIIAMKGPEGEKELEQAAAWLNERGLHCRDILRFRLPASGSVRQLLVLGH